VSFGLRGTDFSSVCPRLPRGTPLVVSGVFFVFSSRLIFFPGLQTSSSPGSCHVHLCFFFLTLPSSPLPRARISFPCPPLDFGVRWFVGFFLLKVFPVVFFYFFFFSAASPPPIIPWTPLLSNFRSFHYPLGPCFERSADDTQHGVLPSFAPRVPFRRLILTPFPCPPFLLMSSLVSGALLPRVDCWLLWTLGLS